MMNRIEYQAALFYVLGDLGGLQIGLIRKIRTTLPSQEGLAIRLDQLLQAMWSLWSRATNEYEKNLDDYQELCSQHHDELERIIQELMPVIMTLESQSLGDDQNLPYLINSIKDVTIIARRARAHVQQP